MTSRVVVELAILKATHELSFLSFRQDVTDK